MAGSFEQDTEPDQSGTLNASSLEEGYRQMAADADHEAEALAWGEAMLFDVCECETPPNP